jgi:mono/diheme cytochrome c family protein
VEVLHDVRPVGRRRVTRWRLALLGAALGSAALAGGCGGGDRDFGRADTAALLSDSLAALVAESARAAADSTISDSALTDSIRAAFGGDSLGVDAAGAVAHVVLRADSAAGDVLYHGRGGCLTCHALNGAGVAGIAPSLRDSVWLHGDGDPAMIERIVREGVAQPKSVANRMPGFAAMLGDAEIRRIAAYVFAISHAGGTVLDTAAVPTPADALDREGAAEP